MKPSAGQRKLSILLLLADGRRHSLEEIAVNWIERGWYTPEELIRYGKASRWILPNTSKNIEEKVRSGAKAAVRDYIRHMIHSKLVVRTEPGWYRLNQER